MLVETALIMTVEGGKHKIPQGRAPDPVINEIKSSPRRSISRVISPVTYCFRPFIEVIKLVKSVFWAHLAGDSK